MQLLDLLPLQLAASAGTVDGLDTPRLVAAGFTLLQRSAPLVRALTGKRSVILLPDAAHFLTALAASDGRGALLLNPNADPAAIAVQLRAANVGAIFTTEALLPMLPSGTVSVLLDDAPTSARVVINGRDPQPIDLGSHFGLELTGDVEAEGREEECLAQCLGKTAESPTITTYTHRDLISRARAAAIIAQLRSGDHQQARAAIWEIDVLVADFLAPLIAGCRVTTRISD